MGVLAILIGLLPHSAAQAGRLVAPAWEWRGEPRDRRLVVDLVHADVRISVAAHPPTVRIFTDAPAGAAVSFSASADDGAVGIRDRYPLRATRARECLPPVDAGRGDYWTHPAKLRVAIRIPPGTALSVRVRSGDIIADAGATQLDLHTGDGSVTRLAPVARP